MDRHHQLTRTLSAVLVAGVLASAAGARAADPPTPQLALSFKPAQKGVEYDIPDKADVEKCKVQVERSGKSSGWIVYGPAGQILRRFVDTNADNVVDQWRFYQNGLEVYRDIDSNFNNKIDQSRWLNTGGSRWAVDANEDGQIESWKMLSAAEASREAVRALVARDEKLLATLLITAAELESLGVSADLSKQVLASVADPARQLRDITGRSKTVTAETRWMRFDSPPPGMVPADDGKATSDVLVYEHAMAIVETGSRPSLVQLGEMVRVGDVWKLTQVPRPVEESVEIPAGGFFMVPAGGAPLGDVPNQISPEMQKLLEELQALDRDAPAPDAGVQVLSRYNARRADLLERISKLARTPDERAQWIKQMVDGIATAVQTGAYPQGLERLTALEDAHSKSRSGENADLVAYVRYRRLLSQYTTDLQAAVANANDRAKVQDWWLAQLEDFVTSHPQAEDAPGALFQLGMALEFAGKTDDARTWYAKLARQHAATEPGQRAAGAVKRLDLTGKPFALAGPGLTGGAIDTRSLRGKVVLVIFWSTWCKPCTEDLPQLRALYDEHRQKGFEIVGVNLDTTTEPVQPYLRQHRVSWPQIHEPGGLESGPGREFGIISVPTMFLVSKAGMVVSRSTSVAEVKEKLPELLKAR
ncbi:MAG TPA: redoxin domain-containing protein [Planctomycetaceae bacterium]|nr:redoxin domain-containing protein [Planctomycetaceae bacterium]